MKLQQKAIDAAKNGATEAIRRCGYTKDAYVCRWGRAPYCGFFFSDSDEAAENYRQRAEKSEGKKLTIVAVVRAADARAAKGAA